MKHSILITGANRGIGLELARVFSQNDWEVIATCREPAGASDLKGIQAASEGRLTIRKLDVIRDKDIAALAEELAGKPLDILLNNAGILGPKQQEFGRLDEGAWLETFAVNSLGPYRMARALVDNVAGSKRRIIATITSEMGSTAGNSSGGYYVYRSSKAAANMIMKNLSLDLRREGITCVALHPGWVRTRMGGSSAPLSPEGSAEGLFQVLTSLDREQNGTFLDYRGKEILW
jgi:NAD(P)-dependent dehydrogenase (short-subunit alcohol dehydrogenase family)